MKKKLNDGLGSFDKETNGGESAEKHSRTRSGESEFPGNRCASTFFPRNPHGEGAQERRRE